MVAEHFLKFECSKLAIYWSIEKNFAYMMCLYMILFSLKLSLCDESVLVHLNKSLSSASEGQYKASKVLCSWIKDEILKYF